MYDVYVFRIGLVKSLIGADIGETGTSWVQTGDATKKFSGQVMEFLSCCSCNMGS